MKTNPFTRILAIVAIMSVGVTSCNTPAQKQETATEQVAAKPDMTAIKTEIQAIETEWASATTAKDIDKIMALYADDAIEMADDEPMCVGKDAIRQVLLKSMKARKAGTTVSYETMDVYGDGNLVTEVGKTTVKDASGNVVSTGKYMGIFEKRDGKFICIRDINNEDQKDK
ncbi:YybH family protein [Larkinella rosea]|uniref:Nuclear transport factor 2 family protein n=1 Tax=Larkinella rosea TaxID=2025312 RepID=A0A3P1C2X1_9BACT|nr:nuclear transport factor 2 family protein [Larkinella rosea]RRB07657.1 nuclear transport factor 2 family protein [Larkinella rosea]